MRVMTCVRMLPNRTYCYAGVLRETCNSSAADIDMLKTIVHNAKFLEVVDRSCTVGESHCRLFISVDDKQVAQLSQPNHAAACISFGKNIHVGAKSVHLTWLYPTALTSTNDHFTVLRHYVCTYAILCSI